MKFHVLGIIDATVMVDVDAATPEEAAELASDRDEMRPRLCHQCSSHLEVGELYITRVHDEAHEQVWTDETPNLSLATDEALAAEVASRRAVRVTAMLTKRPTRKSRRS